jgi:hypothetical protein
MAKLRVRSRIGVKMGARDLASGERVPWGEEEGGET